MCKGNNNLYIVHVFMDALFLFLSRSADYTRPRSFFTVLFAQVLLDSSGGMHKTDPISGILLLLVHLTRETIFI